MPGAKIILMAVDQKKLNESKCCSVLESDAKEGMTKVQTD